MRLAPNGSSSSSSSSSSPGSLRMYTGFVTFSTPPSCIRLWWYCSCLQHNERTCLHVTVLTILTAFGGTPVACQSRTMKLHITTVTILTPCSTALACGTMKEHTCYHPYNSNCFWGHCCCLSEQNNEVTHHHSYDLNFCRTALACSTIGQQCYTPPRLRQLHALVPLSPNAQSYSNDKSPQLHLFLQLVVVLLLSNAQ